MTFDNMTFDKQLPSTRTTELDSIFLKAQVVPVLVIERVEDAIPLGRALVEGGLQVLEVTLRTNCTLEAVRRMRQELKGISIGVGTIMTPAQYRQAEQVGADFVTSPGTTDELYRHGVESPVPMLPGISSVTEVMDGWQFGYRRFKFFPAEASGGIKMLQAIAPPLQGVKFCPAGGIDMDNVADYLALPNVMSVSGTWLVPSSLVDRGDWQEITRRAQQASQRFHH